MKLVELSINQWLPCPLTLCFGLDGSSVKGYHNTNMLVSVDHGHSVADFLFILLKSLVRNYCGHGSGVLRILASLRKVII